ncbi:uncharacterized protein LOC126555615 [Aphis gossypii]|uniref:uncharacterized protein LOC126555615 n=1 Tax=Aphis gossypii TaxID=80765 RepID=UPI00215997FB|nr:uncharacterized protein LOC126555615 [Aphis gossypii]
MPPKRKGANLSRNTSRSRSMRNTRAQRTEEQIQQQNTDARVSMAQLRQEQSEDTRAERNEVIRLEQRQSRRFTVNRRRINYQQRQQNKECPHCHALKFKNEPAGMCCASGKVQVCNYLKLKRHLNHSTVYLSARIQILRVPEVNSNALPNWSVHQLQ